MSRVLKSDLEQYAKYQRERRRDAADEAAALKRDVAMLRKALREALADAEYMRLVATPPHPSDPMQCIASVCSLRIDRITATLARKARNGRR